jgi:hypothetical protein
MTLGVIKAVLKDVHYLHNLVVPRDEFEFGVLYEILDTCNMDNHHLEIVANVYPEWKPIADNWIWLCRKYNNNEPIGQYLRSLAQNPTNITNRQNMSEVPTNLLIEELERQIIG